MQCYQMPSQYLNKYFKDDKYIERNCVRFSFADDLYLSFSGSSCAVSAGIKYTPAMAADTPG